MFNLQSLEFFEVLKKIKFFSHIKTNENRILNIKPTDNFLEIIKLLDEVKLALTSLNKYDDIPLDDFFNLNEILKRSKIGGTLNEDELLTIASLINVSKNVINYVKELNNINIDTSVFDNYINNIVVNDKLKTEITNSIDNSAKVVSSASLELLEVRNNLSNSESKLRSKMNELLTSKSKMLNESLIVIRNQRMCLPVKVEFKNTFKGIIHDESASQTTVYIEPQECIDINMNITKLIHDEKQEVFKVLKRLSKEVTDVCDELMINFENLLSLDIIYAKAKFAKENSYVYPNVVDKQEFNLIQAKHPLIPKDKIVPIDVSLGGDYNVIIITGPNTGGKTVALKTVGLISCMIQSGLFVPCDETSTIGVFDNVFVDIGDEQSIEKSLSTFSSHMTKIIEVVNHITPKSLVLLDELGSGTDPKEGSSLAISIIKYLKNTNARLIVTTHYSDLKGYALTNQDIMNASVEFDEASLKPTYRLLMGVGGKSNAISIARRLGLNLDIIEEAIISIKSSNTKSDDLIDKIDEQHIKNRHIEDELNHKIKQYNTLIQEVETLKRELTLKEESFIKDAKTKALDIIDKAKEDASSIIEELSNMKDKSFKEHELADIKYQVKSLKVNEEEIVNLNHEYKVGDMVYIKKYDKHSVIVKIKKGKYEINIGTFAMMFAKNEISPSTYKEVVKPSKIKKKPVSTNTVSSNMSSSLDLRGFRYEDVANEIDKFIDNAYLKNISIISVIHGHGTGTIRKAVWEYLKTSSYVKSYRYGAEGEGLNGVTIVTLK